MISIVTPSFNQLDWLLLAIASVADQNEVEVEHIIQDAGTSGIEDFFKKEATGRSEHYRPQLLIEKDEGMYDAVNRGLSKATGEICAYLNCDEQYLPGTLRKVSDFFAANPNICVLFGDVVLTNREGYPVSYRQAILPTRRHIRASHLNTLSCAMFFRRKLVEQGFVFDPKLKDVGDAEWVERLLIHNVPMRILPEPLAIFAFTGQNRSADPFARSEAARRSSYSNGLIAKAARAGIIAEHRFRKALAGAYKKRDVTVQIYTLDSLNARSVRKAHQVTYRWPNN